MDENPCVYIKEVLNIREILCRPRQETREYPPKNCSPELVMDRVRHACEV